MLGRFPGFADLSLHIALHECADIVERSIRDVLEVVPDELRPVAADGATMQVKPYEPYVPRAGGDEEGMSIDTEYEDALNELRVDLSSSVLEE